MSKVIYIEAGRDVYREEDASPWTMTVRELIEELDQYEADTPVLIRNDAGYTYGFINSNRVIEH